MFCILPPVHEITAGYLRPSDHLAKHCPLENLICLSGHIFQIESSINWTRHHSKNIKAIINNATILSLWYFTTYLYFFPSWGVNNKHTKTSYRSESLFCVDNAFTLIINFLVCMLHFYLNYLHFYHKNK